MAREQIDFREDFKLQVTLLQENPNYDPKNPELEEQYIIVDPTTVPFVINLFSLENDKKVKSSNFQATWDLTTKKNFIFDEENTAILIIFDNRELRPLDKGIFKIGQLQGTIWFGYPDSQMPDDTFNCGDYFNTNIDIINIDLVSEYE